MAKAPSVDILGVGSSLPAAAGGVEPPIARLVRPDLVRPDGAPLAGAIRLDAGRLDAGRTDTGPVRTDALSVRTDALSVRTDALSGRTDALSGRTDALSGRTDALSGRTDALSSFSLANALRTVFGSAGQIIGEHFYPWPLRGPSAQHLRADRIASPHRTGDSDPAAAVFRLALSAAQRRENLQGQPWVVAVVRSACDSGVCEMAAAMFQQVPRLLLIACETPEPAYAGPCSTLGWLPFEAALTPFPLACDALWQEIECGDEPAELVALLERLKQSDRSVLVRLRFESRLEQGQEPKPHSAAGGIGRAASGATRLAGAKVVADCLLRRMEADPTVMLVDFTERAPWERLAQRFPDRYFRAAEADANVFRWCADLADTGHRLVLSMTTSVLARHHRDIAQRLCRPGCAVSLLLEFDHGAVPTAPRGVTAVSHQLGIAGDALQGELPSRESSNGLDLSGLGTIMVPSSTPVLEQMLSHALNHSGPCVLALSAHDYAPAELPARPVFPGKADLLADGNALVLLAVGQAVAPALSAARELTVEGISTAVIDVRFLRPLDGRTLLASLEPAQAIVLLDDPSTPSGFVDLLLEFYEAHRLTPPLLYMPAPTARGRSDASDRQKTSTREIVEQCQQFLEVVHTRAESLPGGASTWEHVAALPGLDVGQAKDAVQRVLSRRLSDELSLWATVYEEVGNRGEYLWKWCREGVELTTLPCVAPSLLEHAGDTKVLSIILCVLLDDIADKHGNLAFLETLIDIVEHGRFQARSALGPDERRYAEVTCRLSEIYRRRLQEYPCFEAFEELLQYDLIQFSNTLRYSHLLNRQLSLLNMAEHDLYLPHNMHMMSFATIDLMCSPEFKVEDLGHLREAVWHGQCMGRIGNLLSTWRREIVQRDFTSGVFARAVAEGDLTIGDLRDGDPRDLEAAICRGRHEQYFFDRWHHHRQRLRASLAKIRSVQIQGLLEGHERFFQLHLASRGRI